MSNISYRPILENTVWSYSRLGSFKDCPYRFFLKYIKGYKETDMFYASYGSFIHKLLEKFYRGEMTQDEMLTEFMTGFSSQVKGARPKKSIVEKYIADGCNYLKEFVPLPFETVAVEKEIHFEINGYKFIGYIDHLGISDGKYYITDNKSRNLKKRSNRVPPTKNDQELDKMLRQLYLYSIGIEQEYGVLPEALCFNCFRSGVFIKEKFDIQKFEEAKQWAVDSIEKILETGDFDPNQEYFTCNYLCGVQDHCEYNDLVREFKRYR